MFDVFNQIYYVKEYNVEEFRNENSPDRFLQIENLDNGKLAQLFYKSSTSKKNKKKFFRLVFIDGKVHRI